MTPHTVAIASYTVVFCWSVSRATGEQESRNASHSINEMGIRIQGETGWRPKPTYQRVENNGTAPGSLQLRSKVNQMNYLSGKKNGEDCAPKGLAYQLCVWGWSTKLARVLIAHAEPLAVP